MVKRQKKISLPLSELLLAKTQAEKDGFGSNVTGWIRWVIRSRAMIPDNTIKVEV